MNKVLKKHHGRYFTAKIHDKFVEGKITVEGFCDRPCIYLCQNTCDGTSCKDKQGYSFSWVIENFTVPKQNFVTDLVIFMEQKVDDILEIPKVEQNMFKKGDYIVTLINSSNHSKTNYCIKQCRDCKVLCPEIYAAGNKTNTIYSYFAIINIDLFILLLIFLVFFNFL